MKTGLIIALLCLLAVTTFAQQMTPEEWNEQAKTNIRLLPEYGHVPKSENQKNADQELIETTMVKYSSRRKASDHFIELGFKYLFTDVKTAMYRFNQAYLFDSTNTDIYWGYGGVYMTLGLLQKAADQYAKGLSIDPTSTHLLTDYGTYFMAQYYALQPLDERKALPLLNEAITYLTKSYHIDKKNPNTSLKLSACYYLKKDCKNAWKYYDECMAVGGQPITEDFTNALKEQCRKNN